ncbi:MAG: hypothetical protein IJZ01_07585 [Paraprevotella sp.]|nr:hypothetical protein [Paraprevotella sp.]
MKKWVVFLLGSITGAILTILVLGFIGMSMNKNFDNGVPGLALFEEPGNVMESPSFKIFQVLENNRALAKAMEKGYSSLHTGMIVLLIGDENTYYYDDQIVEIPEGKTARHIGTYQYVTNSEMQKTVPVIQIFDK